MLSKLATIQTIKALTPKVGADMIESVTFDCKKTDEIRIQTCVEIMEKYQDKELYTSIKYDGTGCKMHRYENNFGVRSPNLELLETG